LFVHFETAFDRIWNVEQPSGGGWWQTVQQLLFHRLRAFLILVCLGALVLVVFIAGLALATVRSYTQQVVPLNDIVWRVLEAGVSVVLNAGILTLLYKWLPKVPIRWPEAAQGGVLAAILWELGRLALTYFIGGDKFSPYGLVGAFIAVMLWVYYASIIIFLAAEYVQVICQECGRSAADEREA
jgi:membrane protein